LPTCSNQGAMRVFGLRVIGENISTMNRSAKDDQHQTALPQSILEAVKLIEIRTRRLVDDLFSGEYHSVFRGLGIEFTELREYVPGDDCRSIDWKVTARIGEPYVKVFEEERELTLMLLVDVSRSGRFGSSRRNKLEIAAELCGVLAFAAIANKDKVGLVLFSDRVEKFIPPDKGKTHVLRLIMELLAFEPEGSCTDLNPPLSLIGSVLKRKSTVFLVSDFWASGYDTALQVVNRRHDCVAIRIRDPREIDLPPVGLVHLVDAESGQTVLVDSSDPGVQQTVRERVKRLDRNTQRLLQRNSIDLVDIDVTRSYVEPLRRFFARRTGRRRTRR